MLVSPLLLAELREVLARRKFRRWLPADDAAAFVDAVALLADLVEDPAGRLAHCSVNVPERAGKSGGRRTTLGRPPAAYPSA